MATKRTASSRNSQSGKRALTVRKDTLKDLTPDAGSPKGGAITPYAPAALQTQTWSGVTPYKDNISY